MSLVFVLDTKKQVLNPVHPGRARRLLTEGKAAVFKRYPFTIILKQAVESPQVEPLRLKIDPGSKTTGLAIVNETSGAVVFAAELIHRGQQIVKALADRRTVRRNRRRPEGWLPPSLESQIQNIVTWAERFRRVCPITAISQELVKFDMQQMEHPDISGVEYQEGTLHGYEVKEYLLEKWGRQCAYCGVTGVPLEVEHIIPRSKSHDNRVCNLTLACHPCNQAKANRDIREFLKDQPDLLQRILAQSKAPLRNAAAVNATRWLRFVCSKTARTGEEQQRDTYLVDN